MHMRTAGTHTHTYMYVSVSLYGQRPGRMLSSQVKVKVSWMHTEIRISFFFGTYY